MKQISLIFYLIISTIYANAQTNELVEEYLSKIMVEKKIPGLQLVVIKDDEIKYATEMGNANVSFSVPVDENTIFSINSIGKIFTATALMQLVEQKKLNLSDKISSHLNNLPESWHSVTIKQLLSHTSGLPYIEDQISEKLISDVGIEDAWKKVQQLPLQAKPGEKFGYNATNYVALYKLIEKSSGLSFLEFIQKHQFDAAGIQRITYGNSFDVEENKSPTYSYYYQNKITYEFYQKDTLRELYEEFPKELWAGAGVFTSARDMAKWILALFNGKLLKDNTSIEMMWQPVELNSGQYGGFGGILNKYGLGFPVVERVNHPAVAPLGGGRASLFIYPKDNLTIILFTNLMGSFPHEIVDDISKFYLE